MLTLIAAGLWAGFQAVSGASLYPAGGELRLSGVPDYAQGALGPDWARIRVLKTHANPWTVQLQTTPFPLPIRKGEVVFVQFRARTLSSRDESGTSAWYMAVQLNREPWTQVGASAGGAGKAWRSFHQAFRADRDFAAGEVEITFHLASRIQEVEFRDLRARLLPADTDLSKLPHTELTYEGREPNAPWRKKAEAMIERHRKGGFTVVVTKGGRPLRGATVQIEMTRHAYPFGTFTEYHVPKNDPDSERFRRILLSRRFSRLTVPIYWADWGWAGENSRREYIQTIEWCLKHGLRMKAHNLLWPSYQYSPQFLRNLDDAGLRKAIYDALEERTRTLSKYPFENVDVLNEIRTETAFADRLGWNLYVDVFRKARAAWPKAELVYNDYSVFEGSQAGGPTTQASEALARRLKATGAPVTMLGWQAHFGEDLTPPERVWQLIDRFQKTVGLPIEVTEFDVSTRDEKAQADYTRDLLTAWFAHPKTSGFTMWGFWEGSHWKPDGAMYRKDWTPKPNAKVWDELVTRKWWTKATLKTDGAGRARFRGFFGDYEVRVGGRTFRAKFDADGRTLRAAL
ncbi:MAG: endo-1,4-beta-xylanase [Fimbriimonadaceae bacterium]